MKRINAILGIALLLVSAFSIGLLLQRQQGRYSAHKWHEGYAEEVVFDVMENHVYPGVSLSEAERLLGGGKELSEAESASLAERFLPSEDGTPYGVWLYELRSQKGSCRYFLLVHDNETVVKTVLVDSLD